MNALMRSCFIEVGHIRFEDTVELLLMEDKHVVQALSSHTAQKTFTGGIRSRRMRRRCEDLDAAHGSQHERNKIQTCYHDRE